MQAPVIFSDLQESIVGSVTGTCIYHGSIGDRCATLSKQIDEALCDGQPVLLRVTSRTSGYNHFLLTDGQNIVSDNDTISILDPSCENCVDLFSSYDNQFRGYRLFRGPTETSDPTSIVVSMGSPTTFYVADALDNRTGWDPITGQILEEIPNSRIASESIEDNEPGWNIYIFQPTEDNYRVFVFGQNDGEFTLDISATDLKVNPVESRFIGTTMLAREYSYSIDYSSELGVTTIVQPTTYTFLGFAPPIDTNEFQVFKINRTIPIKFFVQRNDGGLHDDIAVKWTIQKLDDDIPTGVPIEPDASGEANEGGYFRYDPAGDQYIYNWSTKDLSTGTWKCTIKFDDGSEEELILGLK